jgi:hypothetical protein
MEVLRTPVVQLQNEKLTYCDPHCLFLMGVAIDYNAFYAEQSRQGNL